MSARQLRAMREAELAASAANAAEEESSEEESSEEEAHVQGFGDLMGSSSSEEEESEDEQLRMLPQPPPPKPSSMPAPAEEEDLDSLLSQFQQTATTAAKQPTIQPEDIAKHLIEHITGEFATAAAIEEGAYTSRETPSHYKRVK